MRILHVLASAHLGGAEHVCLDLAGTQQSRGHSVSLLIFEDGAASEAARQRGLHLVPMPSFPVEAATRKSRWAAAMASLKLAVTQVEAEIVHSHVPLTNLICHRTLPLLRIPWVATMHGSWKQFAYAPETVERPLLRPYLAFRHAVGAHISLGSAARIGAISDYVKRQLHSVGIPGHKIEVIYNGLSGPVESLPKDEARLDLGLDPKGPVVGAMGYFAPVKGFDLLIRAVAELHSAGTRFQTIIAGADVLGDDRYRNRLEQLIARYRLHGKLHLIGSLSVLRFMSALDILAVPSRTEGFSLVLLEAMRRGLPSVVTSEGGCVEVARPEVEGVHFRSGSAASLAIALRRLIEDPALRSRLGDAARKRALSEFTLEKCVDSYEPLYSGALAECG